jgi:hypothetical protein
MHSPLLEVKRIDKKNIIMDGHICKKVCVLPLLHPVIISFKRLC